MAKHGPGSSPDAGYFLIVDEKPDGRFYLGATSADADAALMKWQEVGIVKHPYTIEHVAVRRFKEDWRDA